LALLWVLHTTDSRRRRSKIVRGRKVNHPMMKNALHWWTPTGRDPGAAKEVDPRAHLRSL